MKPGPSSPQRGLIHAVAIFFFLSVAYAAWAARRGFDITDNGYYLLVSQHPEDVRVALTGFHLYASPIFHLVDQSVFGFRLAGLLMLLAAAAFFFAGVRTFATTRLFRGAADCILFGMAGWFAVGQGVLMYYAWTLYTPSYNLLAVAGMLASTGLLLSSVVCMGQGERRKSCLAGAAAGAVAGVVFFVKFTAGVPFVVASLAFAGIVLGLRAGAAVAACHLGGLCAWCCIHFLVFQSAADWLQQWRQGWEYAFLLLPSVSAAGLSDQYIRPVLTLFYRVARDFGIIYLLLIGGSVYHGRLQRRRAPSPPGPDTVAGICMVLFVLRGLQLGYHLGGDLPSVRLLNFFGGMVVLAALLNLARATGGFARRPEFGGTAARDMSVFILLLLLLPFIGAFGTNVPFLKNAMLYSAFWFAVILVLASNLLRLQRSTVVAAALVTIASGFATSELVTSGEESTYRLNDRFSRQTVAAELGSPPSLVELDPSTARFFLQLRQAAAASGFRPGNDIIVLTHMPGLVYALGGRSPGGPWYTRGYPGSETANARMLQLAPPERIRSAFVITLAGDAAAARIFGDAGIRFPEHYEQIARLEWPVGRQRLDMWRPRLP